ncbi:MAG: hypothetical protein SOR61_06950 [Evtepia sp.]|uniref:hypothetical protein n=1 Tax=Evtepia sp. TaxID=2773933 RepID=UPI002A75AE9C|nr:hypothetical protein [Evtepia sp.]MDY3014905.1 hypothetical protein [Evtepia sp.]
MKRQNRKKEEEKKVRFRKKLRRKMQEKIKIPAKVREKGRKVISVHQKETGQRHACKEERSLLPAAGRRIGGRRRAMAAGGAAGEGRRTGRKQDRGGPGEEYGKDKNF